MAWLVCVKRDDREPYQYVNDLISIYEDDQSFPDHYPKTFNMLKVNGTKADVENVLNQIKPEIIKAVWSIEKNSWIFPISEYVAKCVYILDNTLCPKFSPDKDVETLCKYKNFNDCKYVEFKEVWRPAGTDVKKWYDLVNDFKFHINIGELTPEEKQLLQTYDITHPSITSFINKIVKDIASDLANSVEETDLKNTLPTTELING